MIKTVIKVEGMMCGMCEAHVSDIIRKNFKVKKVYSSHVKGETVVLSQEPLKEEDVLSAFKETGYKVKGVYFEQAAKKGFLFFKKK